MGLTNVIDQVIADLAGDGVISLQGLRATATRSGYRSFFDPVPAMLHRQNFWLEYYLDFWKRYEHPVWLRGHSEYLRLAGQGFEDYERAVPKRLLKDIPDQVLFRIDLPIGAEIDDVVRNITLQIQDILNRFQALISNK